MPLRSAWLIVIIVLLAEWVVKYSYKRPDTLAKCVRPCI